MVFYYKKNANFALVNYRTNTHTNMRKNYTIYSVLLTILLLLNGFVSSAVATISVTSIAPVSVIPGATITIVGTGFSTTDTDNVVYFGGVKGSVVSGGSTSTMLVVTVPVGAQYSTVTVLNKATLQSASYGSLFAPDYDNSCFQTNSQTFKTRIDQTITSPFSATSHPEHTAIGDIDGDGKPELIVSTYFPSPSAGGQGILKIFHNVGTLQNVAYDMANPVVCTTSNGARNVKLADLDGDGKLDIIVACSGSGRISCLRNTSTPGNISMSIKLDLNPLEGPTETAIADFDGDGKLDIAAICYNTSQVKVFHSHLTPTAVGIGGRFSDTLFGSLTSFDSFSVVPGSFPGSLFAADFDGDGAIDLVTANTFVNSVSVLLNTSVSTPGHISFATHQEFSVGSGTQCTEVQVADIVGDSKPEIVVANYGTSDLTVFENTSTSGTPNFVAHNYSTGVSVYALGLGDFDGDGKVDIALSNNTSNTISILHNNVGAALDNTSFTLGAPFATGAGPKGISVGDMDGDNKPDIVVSNYDDNSISIFENKSLPITNPITGFDSICVSSTTGNFHTSHCANATGFWASTTGKVSVNTIAGSDTVATFTGLSAGADTIVYGVVYLSDTNFVKYPFSVKAIADTGNITGPTNVCLGKTINLTDTATGGIWSSSDTTIAIVSNTGLVTALTTGSVVISYTASSVSCLSLSAQHSVSVNPNPVAGVISSITPPGICVGSSTTLTVTGTSGATGFVWDNLDPSTGTLSSSAISSAIITGSTVGSDTILYIVTNAFGCTDTVQKVIGVIATGGTSPSLPITGINVVCVGAFEPQSNGLPGGTWTSSNTGIATVNASGQVYGVSSGNVTISYAVNYGCGIADTFTAITINPLPVPGVISGANSVYLGAAITLTTTGVGGTWTSGTPSVATVSSGGVVNSVALGTTIISYSVTNSCGTLSDTQSVSVIPVPVYTIPTILTVTPVVGIPLATTVNITGTGFSNILSNNVVYFGGVKGNVISADTTSLIVTLPIGAQYASVTYLNLNSLLACNQAGFFLPTYDASCFTAGSASFRPKVDYVLAGSPAPTHAVLGDIDGDGKEDLVVCTYNPFSLGQGILNIYMNTGSAGIISYAAPVVCTTSNGARNIKLADLDGDGKLDIVVACSGSGRISCLRNLSTLGNIVMSIKTDLNPLEGPTETAIADYDGDGKLDIAAICYNSSQVKIFHNEMGSLPLASGVRFPNTFFGTLTTFDSFSVGTTVGNRPGSLFAADFNGDGHIDIVTANTNDNTVSVLQNNSTLGHFSFVAHQDFAVGALPTEVQAADINGDNKPEIIVATYGGSSDFTVLENTTSSASPSFSRTDFPGGGSAFALGLGDVDGDSKVDIILSHDGTNAISVVKNTHSGLTITSGSFAAPASYSTGLEPNGLSVGDIDGDKRADVVSANKTGNSVSVFKNISAPIISPISGSDSVCIGASISVVSPHCNNAVGYWSMSNGHATILASLTSDTLANITGVTAGVDTVIYTVVYLSDTSKTTFVINVKQLADTGLIVGASSVCMNGTTTLTNTATGTWTSSNTSVATVDPVTGVVTPVSVGTTIISFTAQSVSCGPLTATHPLTVNALPDAGIITSAFTSTCIGNSITLSASIAGGTWLNLYPAVAGHSPSGTTDVVTGATVGTDTIIYVVTTPTCGNDTAIKVVSVVPPSGTTTPIIGTTTYCIGDSSTLSNSIVGGAWSVSNATVATINSVTGVVHALSSGSDTVRYHATFPCGSGASDTFVVITVNPAPHAGTISGLDSVCQAGTITLTSTGTTGTWHSRYGNTNVNATTGAVIGLTPGTDSVVFVSITTCGVDSIAHAVTVKAAPDAGAISSATGFAVCAGSTLTLTDGIPGGVWSSISNTVATVSSTGIVSGVSADTTTIIYTVTTFSCGSAHATHVVTVNPLPNAGSISGADSVCINATISLSTTGAGVGAGWSNFPGHTSVDPFTGDVTGLTTGTDTIVYTVATATCGSDTAMHYVTVNALPDAGTISGADSVCSGSLITLTASVGGGSWSSASGAVATVDASGVVTGVSASLATTTIVYTATTFSCGTDTANHPFTVKALPNAGTISGADSVCHLATIPLSTTGSGGTWSSTSNTIATVNASGVVTGVSASLATTTIVYTATTFSCGTDTAQHPVTVNVLPDAGTISGADSVCSGSLITLTASVGGGSWSSASGAVATVDASGVVTGVSASLATTTIVYTATTFSCGTDTANHPFTVKALPNAGTISGPVTVCVSATITMTDASAGGVWSMTNSNASISATGVVTGTSGGADTVVYTVTNSCGTAYDTLPINVNQLPVAGTITGANDSMCVGSTMTITSTVIGGTWSSIHTGIATIDASGVVTAISAGTDTLQYILTNSCGSDTANYQMTIIAVPVAGVIQGSTFVCIGSTMTLTDTVTAAAGGVWSSNNTAIATIDATGQVFPVDTGLVVIHYTVTNFCGVADTSDTIRVNPLPFTDTITGSVAQLCSGVSVTLVDSTTGGVWSSSNVSVASVTSGGVVTAGAAGTAIISYTYTNVCGSAYAFDTITVHPIPALTSGLTASVCSGSPFSYVPTATTVSTAYSWSRAVLPLISNAANSDTGSISETLISTSPAAVNVVYVYSLTAAGCSNVENLNVTVRPLPVLTTDTSFTVCSGSPILYIANTLTTGTVFAWVRPTVVGITPAGTTGTYIINETLINVPGTAIIPVPYNFTLTANGCVNTQVVHANVEPAPPAAPVITTMSPSYLCEGTMYQNFGTATVPSIGVSYTWSSYNAQVWATGTTDQYCLVNFTAPGQSWVYVSANINGFTCASRDSFAVIVNPATADHPEVFYFADYFNCTPSNEQSYQWGYDDALTLDSTLLSGETNQSYFNASPDFIGKYYWVITTKNGCYQKTYYKTPTGIKNVTNGGITDVNIFPNPNSGSFSVNIASDYSEKATVVITNMIGEKMSEMTCVTNKKVDLHVDAPAGIYFVNVNTPHGKFSGKVTISGK